VCDSHGHAAPPSPEALAAFVRKVAPIAALYAALDETKAWMGPDEWDAAAVEADNGHPQDDSGAARRARRGGRVRAASACWLAARLRFWPCALDLVSLALYAWPCLWPAPLQPQRMLARAPRAPAGAAAGYGSARWRERKLGKAVLQPKGTWYDEQEATWMDEYGPLSFEEVLEMAREQSREGGARLRARAGGLAGGRAGGRGLAERPLGRACQQNAANSAESVRSRLAPPPPRPPRACVHTGFASATSGTTALGREGVDRHDGVAATVGAIVQQQGGGRAPPGKWKAAAEVAGGSSSEARGHGARASKERSKKRKAAAAAGLEAPADAARRQEKIEFDEFEDLALREAGAALKARGGGRFNLDDAVAHMKRVCGSDWCEVNLHGCTPSSVKGSSGKKLYHAIRDQVKKYSEQ
jgi:hypothetical protein